MTHLLPLWIWLVSIAVSPPPRAPVAARPDSLPAQPHDSALSAAEQALARGRPWQATRLLAPWLRDSSYRNPAIIFLAARAASEWKGWSAVLQLLSEEPWLDSLQGGHGRMLLARAALERRQDTAAVRHVLLALEREPQSGERLLLLARALDRVDARDSSARVYARAAERLPIVSDWLLIRAATVTGDSSARARLYDQITNPLARGRIPWAEAAAHARTGDLVGASRRYAALGERLTSLRLRLSASPDNAPRTSVRRELLALMRSRVGVAAREAIGIMDSVFAPLTPTEELLVARGAAEAGLTTRAASGFARAEAAGLGSDEDRFEHGTVLARLGRNAEAAKRFKQVRAPASKAALAAYQVGRSLVRDGRLEAGRAALVKVVRGFPRDTTAASSALFLRADLASDDRKDAEARRLYLVVAARYPTSRFAPAARFRAAMIALLSGQSRLAAQEFDSLAERHPTSEEAVAAAYWAGRAWADAGDSAIARGRWQSVSSGDPLSYYAARSAVRLGERPWVPPAAVDSFAPDPGIDSVVARAALLARLGLVAESRWELERLTRASDPSPERLLVLANALRGQGMASPAIQLARRALARGAPADARTYRLIYPVLHEDALLAEATEHGLDPNLMAALIRQESNFNPAATSPAGARGLAQVMPDLGERLARDLDYPVWDPVLLYQPDVSIQLGAVHLRELVSRYPQRAHILAAYNAGASRVELWSKRIGVDDPEVFAERISFVETRDYVRIIQRNEDLYRSLYGAPPVERADATPPPGLPAQPANGETQQM